VEFKGFVNLIFANNFNISLYASQPYVDTQFKPLLASYYVANYSTHALECISTVICISVNCAEGYLFYDISTWTLIVRPLPAEYIGETHIYEVTIDCGSVL
jgi:hypothetical protein